MSKDKCTENEDIKLDKKRKTLGIKLKEAYKGWRESIQLFAILKTQYDQANEENKMKILTDTVQEKSREVNYRAGILFIKADGHRLNKCECCGKALRKKENCYTRPINVAFHTETGVDVRSTRINVCNKCRNKKIEEWPNSILGDLFINGYHSIKMFEMMMKIAKRLD